MSAVTLGLLLAFLFQGLLLALLVGVGLLLPKSVLGEPARAVVNWLPPFLGGAALRDWEARNAEQVAQERLAGQRTGKTAGLLAKEMEEAAMQAMLPLLEGTDLDRIVACPEAGQGLIGVTAPEALAIAAHIRKHKSRAEQERIYELAVVNAKRIASRAPGDPTPPPCALQGADHVCCTFALRPLRCRPLHARSIAETFSQRKATTPQPQPGAPEAPRHEEIVAQGIEDGMKRALKSAGLDAKMYELNSALATALGIPDAAERWARGEDVFRHGIGGSLA